MDYQAEYRSKLRTPAEAVRAVKDGDWVDYTSALGFPPLLDAALAARRDELHDVKVRGNLCMGPLQIVECDPEQTHFLYHTWHCSAYERRLCDRGLCYFTPMIFRNLAWYYRQFLTVNVAMACVTPMDRHGYFNLSAATGVSRAILEQADIVILEINEHLPRLRGGFDEVIHISDAAMIVEGAHAPFSDPPEHPASEEDTAIANLLLPHICDGATVQLGIGGMPTVLGKLLARSGLHDLGMHTELCSDAYLELHEAGVLTNRRCTLHRGQGGAAVHLDPLPPDGVGADGLVEEQRVGAQTAQVKGLPLLLNEFGQAGGQVRQHPLAKRQVRVVIGHGMDQRLLAQRGDIALLTIL
mgnify:FL=1